MDLFLTSWTSYVASGIEAAAAVIIGLAAIQSMSAALLPYVRRTTSAADKHAIRLRLGGWLALGLEFELAADILRTAIAPSWNEIGQLAAIIVLRTALNFFLQKEIEKATNYQPAAGNELDAEPRLAWKA